MRGQAKSLMTRSMPSVLFAAAMAVAATLLMSGRTAEAAPVWHFPFSYGDAWRVSCGYGCYMHRGEAYYGLDFNWGPEPDADCGRSALAVANGYVTSSSCDDWYANLGYGCYVKLWHAGGQSSIYAHLQRGSGSSKGSLACLGWRIGRVGKEGDGAVTCHLHFHMVEGGGAYKPEPMYGRRGWSSSCQNLTKLRQETYVSCTGWGCENPQ